MLKFRYLVVTNMVTRYHLDVTKTERVTVKFLLRNKRTLFNFILEQVKRRNDYDTELHKVLVTTR